MYGALSSFWDGKPQRRWGLNKNFWLLLIFVFVNSRKITIQGIYKGIKLQKYIYGVRSITRLVCFRKRHQDFPCTVWPTEGKDDQIFRYSRFSFMSLFYFHQVLKYLLFWNGWILLSTLNTLKDFATFLSFDISEISECEKDWAFLEKCESHM